MTALTFLVPGSYAPKMLPHETDVIVLSLIVIKVFATERIGTITTGLTHNRGQGFRLASFPQTIHDNNGTAQPYPESHPD